jgi:hypothetical protein
MSSFIDKNYRSITTSYFEDLRPETLDPGPGYADTLKVSNCSEVRIENKDLLNDGEDCLDLCRVSDSSFWKLVLTPRGKNGITIKGASSLVYVSFLLLGHGSECDVELGQFDNYWYPGRKPTQFIHLHVDPEGETPIIRLWDADYPAVHGPHRIVRIPKVVWFPYFLFRYTQLRVENIWRRITRQPLILTK